MLAALLLLAYLAPLAGRGRILREAKNPGEGDSPRIRCSRRQPLTPTLSPQERGEGEESSALDQRAAALVERAEGFVAGHGGDQLVEIPFALGLFRLLHLEQIHVVDHTAVDADLA